MTSSIPDLPLSHLTKAKLELLFLPILPKLKDYRCKSLCCCVVIRIKKIEWCENDMVNSSSWRYIWVQMLNTRWRTIRNQAYEAVLRGQTAIKRPEAECWEMTWASEEPGSNWGHLSWDSEDLLLYWTLSESIMNSFQF